MDLHATWKGIDHSTSKTGLTALPPAISLQVTYTQPPLLCTRLVSDFLSKGLVSYTIVLTALQGRCYALHLLDKETEPREVK